MADGLAHTGAAWRAIGLLVAFAKKNKRWLIKWRSHI